jgi:hypothetical protein
MDSALLFRALLVVLGLVAGPTMIVAAVKMIMFFGRLEQSGKTVAVSVEQIRSDVGLFVRQYGERLTKVETELELRRATSRAERADYGPLR